MKLPLALSVVDEYTSLVEEVRGKSEWGKGKEGEEGEEGKEEEMGGEST